MTELVQAVVNGLQMGFLYALVAVGLTIIWGLMEMINFAHGEFLMLGMFGAWGLSAGLGLDPLLAIVPIGLVMYGFGMLVYQHLMRRVQGGDPFTQIFATIGLLFLLQNAVVAGLTSDYRFVNDSFLARLGGAKITLLGITFAVPLLLAAGLALVLFLALYLLDRAHGVRPGAAGHQRGPRRRAAGGHPPAAHVRRRLGPGRRARRHRGRHPRQLLLRLPAGGPAVHRARVRHRRPRRLRQHPRARSSPRSSSG